MFDFREIYEEGNCKILELNILPDNYCNFDCVFCPIGGTTYKGDTPLALEGTRESFIELANIIKNNEVDLVYFNSNGESFINDEFEEIVDHIKSQGLKIKLFSNGYMLGMPEYMRIANKCDEVIGEIKCTTEIGFQKYQRPVEGYTFHDYVSNMALFNKQFKGKFTLIATILKGYNDDEESINWIKDAIKKISPDEVLVETLTDEKLGKAFGIEEEKLSRISEILLNWPVNLHSILHI